MLTLGAGNFVSLQRGAVHVVQLDTDLRSDNILKAIEGQENIFNYALGRTGKKPLMCLVDDVQEAPPCFQSLLLA